MSETATRIPVEGEIWKSEKGAVRIVAHLEDDPDPYWVMFRRPPPAVKEYATVTMRQWRDWVRTNNASCIKKASRI